MVIGKLPVDLTTTVFVAAVPVDTLPKDTLLALVLSVLVAGSTVTVRFFETPPPLPVNVTVSPAGPNQDTIVVKLALVAPAGTVTEFGSITEPESVLCRLTLSPPLGAGALRFTAQASSTHPVIEVVAHVIELNAGAADALDERPKNINITRTAHKPPTLKIDFRPPAPAPSNREMTSPGKKSRAPAFGVDGGRTMNLNIQFSSGESAH